MLWRLDTPIEDQTVIDFLQRDDLFSDISMGNKDGRVVLELLDEDYNAWLQRSMLM